jgi:hypothetical protein
VYILKRQQDREIMWLVSAEPQLWGERDRAIRFETRAEARRAAMLIRLSGDWSIDAAGAASFRLE